MLIRPRPAPSHRKETRHLAMLKVKESRELSRSEEKQGFCISGVNRHELVKVGYLT